VLDEGGTGQGAVPIFIFHGRKEDTICVGEAEWNADEFGKYFGRENVTLKVRENDGHMSVTSQMREDLVGMVERCGER
jgi:hypothetical protein